MTRFHDSLSNFIWACLNCKILIIIAAILTYVGLCVLTLWSIGIWDSSQLKATAVWVLTFAIVTMLDIVTSYRNPKKLRILAAQAVGATTIVVFIAELHVFPLWIELTFVPVIFFIGLLAVTSDLYSETKHSLNIFNIIIGIIGIIFIANSALHVANNINEFITWGVVKSFMLPILLSIMYIPFLYLILVYINYEKFLFSLNINPKIRPYKNYAILRSVFAFGMNIDLVQRFKRNLQMEDNLTRPIIDRVLEEVRLTANREKSLLPVPEYQGWSPFLAARFLEDKGVRAKDYHRLADMWMAYSDPVSLGRGIIPCQTSYILYGEEAVATRLILSLESNNMGEIEIAERMFWSLCECLLLECSNSEARLAFADFLSCNDNGEFQVGWVTVSLSRDDWAIKARSGCTRRLEVKHLAHTPTIIG